MAAAPLLASMAAGEISPFLFGRHDLTWHSSAARTLLNFVPTPWGPIRYSAGLRHVAEVKDSTKFVRIMSFVATGLQGYVLELGDQSIRFYTDKGRVENPPGTPVQLLSGDGVPWPHTVLFSIRAAASQDVFYMAHGSYKPRELRRASSVSWTIPAFAFKDGPYYPENTTTRTLTPSGVGPAGITLTLSNVDAVNNGQGFLATDVGRLIRFKDSGTTWRWATITAWTSTTVVTVTFDGAALAAATAQTAWRMGLWSDTTGWPVAVVIHQGRLAWGSNPKWSLARVDLSMSGALDVYSPSTAAGAVNDDNAIAILVTSAIRDLRSMRDLMAFTMEKEQRITSGKIDEPLTPTNVVVIPADSHGCADVTVAEASDFEVFVQRDGRTLRQFGYEITNDGFKAKDLTVRAEHIGKSGAADLLGGFKDLAWAQAPNGILGAVRGDGVLPMLTFLPEQEVYAFMRRRLGHCLAGMVKAESVAAIPYAGVDQLWSAVTVPLAAGTKRYIGFFEEPLGHDDPIETAFHVDCGLTLDNTGAAMNAAATLTPGTGANVVGATGVIFTAGAAVFGSANVGKKILYRWIDTAGHPPEGRGDDGVLAYKTAYATITGYTDTTHVTATINEAWPSLTLIAAAEWRLTVATVSGLTHLEGETVKVWADGAPQDSKTVTGGVITLEADAATVQVGLGYIGQYQPILPDVGAPGQSSLGKARRIGAVRLNLHRTVGGRVRVPGAPGVVELVPYRTTTDPLSTPVPVFSGWTAPIPVPDTWSDNPYLIIEQDIPGPMNIIGIKPQFEVGDAA